jgi:hypothetical protein
MIINNKIEQIKNQIQIKIFNLITQTIYPDVFNKFFC